jgi:hypothetical protein
VGAEVQGDLIGLGRFLFDTDHDFALVGELDGIADQVDDEAGRARLKQDGKKAAFADLQLAGRQFQR